VSTDARLEKVQALHANVLLRGDLQSLLKQMSDLERLTGKSATGTANARDLVAMRRSLQVLPGMRQPLLETRELREVSSRMDLCEDVLDLLSRSLSDDPPMTITDGRMIREGYSEELDQLRLGGREGKEWIANLEATERERTGIKSLKVGFNSVFGYYLEVTKANQHLVPPDYLRKQTMVNAERYITPDLKEWEAKVLGAEEKINEKEQELFIDLRAQVASKSERLLQTAKAVAEVDVLGNLAELAARNHYVRPEVNDSDRIDIEAGRHPVVEATQREPFVPNDVHLDGTDNQVLIITGPNMAGKSTYLRQVALIVLMAQIGSFVPAKSASIGLVDRIFTRVGAQDDLATGQSTFMVEMNETANILHNATDRSLIVLDEIGRGTSTFDGLSIAWAVAEYLHDLGAKTLFATHYHHLNEMESQRERVKNFRIAVKEEGDHIIFLRQIVRGGTDRSYGIQVARLAGLPHEVIERAKQVLWTLEAESGVGQISPEAAAVRTVGTPVQLTLFEAAPNPVVEELKLLEVEEMTPVQALNKLAELKEKARRRE
ncbi:MAG: DNA mismatch repair protein MutS, partial [Armatimonadetes bacterium]|nr:DNA mismatch repair protein MutS [Armatimonadota bacterium]